MIVLSQKENRKFDDIVNILTSDELELLKIFTLFCVKQHCAWEDRRPTIWLDGQEARQIWLHSGFHGLYDKGILQDIQTGSNEYEIWVKPPFTLKDLKAHFDID